MDRLHMEDGQHPFVLSTTHIATLNRRASRCDHPLAKLTTIATLVPIAAHVLTASKVRGFDRRTDVLTTAAPNGWLTSISLGQAAAAAMRAAIEGRTSGVLFEDIHGAPIAPDADAVAYVDDLLLEDGEGPLPFAWSFRSLREGVFAGMADGGVRRDIVEAQAGLRHMTDGKFSDTFLHLHERAASDWWAAQLGVPVPATIEVIRSSLRQLRWKDGPAKRTKDRGGAA
ncbi:hypothetical protein E5673_08140 [Sphingomonas sp. PAMC26645]|uniref:hypothetical protein n=1 Tax=Sphingomonas sp. PAMC26645 TaxID=2565555 RepID=UPI00109DBEC8|nr:hypothetical protein [Sphingomonas sp. PAMC26645]QCB42204.1 hypothetical protein E5673_08140 [Sphingomonas sp. PAMC26645]